MTSFQRKKIDDQARENGALDPPIKNISVESLPILDTMLAMSDIRHAIRHAIRLPLNKHSSLQYLQSHVFEGGVCILFVLFNYFASTRVRVDFVSQKVFMACLLGTFLIR